MSKRTDRPAPPLPKRVWSPLGPVKVRLRKRLGPLSKEAPSEAEDFGHYDPSTRTITIRSTLEPWVMWQTFFHEWTHMIFFDAGLHNAFSVEQIEVLCDTFGTARVAEMRNTDTEPLRV